MATRDDLLTQLWASIIDASLQPRYIDTLRANTRRLAPDAPFGDTGGVLERLLAAGADPSDLARLLRWNAYEAAFGTLYALSDPGLDGDDDGSMLHESLLGADPSGREGRPAP